MTEGEWRSSNHPAPMLSFLAGRRRTSQRKFRLFACACCGQMVNYLNRFSRKALTVAEGYADGEVTEEKLRFAWQEARRAAQAARRQGRATDEGVALSVTLTCELDINLVLSAVRSVARCEIDSVDPTRLADAYQKQVPVAFDIFGNPFRPVTFSPSWRTSTAVALASQMYESRDFGVMPILADALQDVGCENEDILSHCRGEGPHVRGCWVVDLVLGKG